MFAFSREAAEILYELYEATFKRASLKDPSGSHFITRNANVRLYRAQAEYFRPLGLVEQAAMCVRMADELQATIDAELKQIGDSLVPRLIHRDDSSPTELPPTFDYSSDSDSEPETDAAPLVTAPIPNIVQAPSSSSTPATTSSSISVTTPGPAPVFVRGPIFGPALTPSPSPVIVRAPNPSSTYIAARTSTPIIVRKPHPGSAPMTFRSTSSASAPSFEAESLRSQREARAKARQEAIQKKNT